MKVALTTIRLLDLPRGPAGGPAAAPPAAASAETNTAYNVGPIVTRRLAQPMPPPPPPLRRRQRRRRLQLRIQLIKSSLGATRGNGLILRLGRLRVP